MNITLWDNDLSQIKLFVLACNESNHLNTLSHIYKLLRTKPHGNYFFKQTYPNNNSDRTPHPHTKFFRSNLSGQIFMDKPIHRQNYLPANL